MVQDNRRQTPGVMYQTPEPTCPICKHHFMGRHNGLVICLMRINGKYCSGNYPDRRKEDKLVKEIQAQEEGW